MATFALVNSDGTIRNTVVSETEISGMGVEFVDITNDPRPIDWRWTYIGGTFVPPPVVYSQEFLDAMAAEELRTGKKITMASPYELGSVNE